METELSAFPPLAERMRPKRLADFIGQEKILGEGSFLRHAIDEDRVPSLLFWGPPGSGKTTLARLIALETKSHFLQLSAVESGKKEIQRIVEGAKAAGRLGARTVLFVDEIHRWNKSQQDTLLPHVEDGTITLIGATTENPSFEVNAALLSRMRVLVLGKHESANIESLLEAAIREDEVLRQQKTEADPAALGFIAALSGGDARAAYNLLEACASLRGRITTEIVESVAERSHLLYDKDGEEHYNIISALHKSMRGGDADASLYWLGRMLEAGEDPLYIARRLIRFASEDIGLGNSFALPQAVAAYQAAQFIGMPECEVNLAQAVVYLAKSKKSNVLYTAYAKVKNDIRAYPNEPVPLHLRNAPTGLMKSLSYGQGYKYTPDYADPDDAKQEYFPERLSSRKYL
ncbi:MAG: replication-associated recombination protein A [Candidatus Moraniibacteriota bacterium]|nr:MAG: replication-associated recombination protein A [Candidatus Moranbacteria bacterium]